MNSKWQDLQEETKQHCRVQSGEKRWGTSLQRSLNRDSVTQILDSIRKNIVKKIGFFLFPVLIFMQSQCNNPDLFFLTLYLFSLLNWFSYNKTFHHNTVNNTLNKQRKTNEKNCFFKSRICFPRMYPSIHSYSEKSDTLSAPP